MLSVVKIHLFCASEKDMGHAQLFKGGLRGGEALLANNIECLRTKSWFPVFLPR